MPKLEQSNNLFEVAENEAMQVVRRLQNASKNETTTFTSQELIDMSDMIEIAINDFRLHKDIQMKEVV